MAVPKVNVSRARRDSRKANWKISAPNVVKCPHCHEYTLPHQVCSHCGYYKGEQVVDMAKKQKSE